MSILVGRSRDAFADLITAVDRKTTFTVNSTTRAPSINIQNSSNFALYQANRYVFGASGDNFICSNVVANTMPLTITPSALVSSMATSITNTLTVSANASFQNDLRVNSNLATSNFAASNIAVVGSAAVGAPDLLNIKAAADPVLSLTPTKILSILGTVGIGTTAPTDALHVTSNARVDRTLTASNVLTRYVGDANRCNVIAFDSNATVVRSNLDVMGSLTVRGKITLDSNLEIKTLKVLEQFTTPLINVDNSNAESTTSIRVAHRISGYANSNLGGSQVAYTYCNAQPIIDASIILPDTAEPFRALHVDAFGRMSLGNAAPTHLLNLDVQPYNSNAAAEGLIYAKSLLADNANVFVVDEQARVGIGTLFPTHALHVVIDDSYDTAVLAIDNEANHAVPYLQFSSNVPLGFDTTKVVLLDVDAAGRLSIGNDAATVADVDPGSNTMLRVRGDVAVTGALRVGGLRGTIDAAAASLCNLSNVHTSNVAAGVVSATTVNATAVNAGTVNMTGMSVDAAANRITASLADFLFTGTNFSVRPAVSALGAYMGVAAPSQQTAPLCVAVSGNGPVMRMSNVDNGTNAIIANMRMEFQQSGGTIGYVSMNNAASDPALVMGFGTGTTNEMLKCQLISTVPTVAIFETMRLTASDTRFGAANAPKPVTVYGTLTSTSNIATNATVTNTLWANTVNVAGTLTAQHTILSSSDSNLKTDVEPIADALAKVRRLTGYTFKRTDRDGATDTGLIAQEVRAVLPEAVGEDANRMLAVAYGNLAGLFVQAINEMAARIEALEGRAL